MIMKNCIESSVFTCAAADDVGEIGLCIALESGVTADALTVGLAADLLLLADAVVLAEVVAFVHADKVARAGRHLGESGFALAAVAVVAGLEEADAVGRADGGVGGVAARVRAVRLDRCARTFRRRVRRAGKTARLLCVRLFNSLQFITI